MPDRRAAILNRLETLLGAIPGLPSAQVFRNRGSARSDERPCMVLLDGTETVHQNFEGHPGRKYARNSPSVMILEPEIFALLESRELGRADEYANELTQYRNAIVWAILHDTELSDLAGANGDIAYRGHATDMQTGRPMQGEMQLFFRFYYLLDPETDLT